MSYSKSAYKPTKAELSLLNILWQLGPATVRQIHDKVSETQTTGYSTVLKILQIMHEKSLVERDETNRAHIYSASHSEVQTQSSLLKDLVIRAFGGSTSKLISTALDESTSKEELVNLRNLLNKLEKK